MKTLADIRTAISTRYRSASRHKATPYLEVMSLGLEKLRLERELEYMGRREERVHKRLAEAKTLLQTRLSQVKDKDRPAPEALGHVDPPTSGKGPSSGKRPFRSMSVEY